MRATSLRVQVPYGDVLLLFFRQRSRLIRALGVALRTCRSRSGDLCLGLRAQKSESRGRPKKDNDFEFLLRASLVLVARDNAD